MRFPFYLCLLFPAVALAAIPAPLTDEEKAAHERLASPSHVPARIHDLTQEQEASRELILKPIESLEGLDRSSHELIEQKEQDDEKLNSVMKEFLNRYGLPGEQLITAPVPEQDKSAASVKDDSKKAPAVETGKTDSDGKTDDSKLMVVDCQDGMYFDSEAGLFVYLRDVRVTDPRFNLQCDNQLKIYLERDKEKDAKAAKKKEEEAKQREADGKTKEALKMPDGSAMNYSGIKSIAASGNVIVTKKGNDGEMMEARAENMTYDGKTGEIILSGGGKKSVRSGEKLLETNGPGSYIRMYGNGDVRVFGKKNVTKAKTSDEKGKPLKMKKK